MINFKSAYDSREIRQGLMSIKQSQMELLRELKNQNHILKKYSPTDNVIPQQKYHAEQIDNSPLQYSPQSHSATNSNSKFNYYNNSDSNLLQSSPFAVQYNTNSGDRKNAGSYLSLDKDRNNQGGNLKSNSINIFDQRQHDYIINPIKQLQLQSQQKANLSHLSDSENQLPLQHSYQKQPQQHHQRSPSITQQHQIQFLRQEYHKIKHNYFAEKQKLKDMALHMEFAASLHNMILKDVLMGCQLDSIKQKVDLQVQGYAREFPEFKIIGLQQAFNIINLHNNGNNNQPRTIPTTRRTQIFPSTQQQTSTTTPSYQQTTNTISQHLLTEITHLKHQLREITLQKQRRQQQVRLIKTQTQYNLQRANRQSQMKSNKINQLLEQLIRHKQQASKLEKEHKRNSQLEKENQQLEQNITRLRSQLQRMLNKIQLLEKANKTIQKTVSNRQTLLGKKVATLQANMSVLEREIKEKDSLIKLHVESITELQLKSSNLTAEAQRLRSELLLTKQQHSQKSISIINKLQQQLQQSKQRHISEISLINKNNQQQQLSLKKHISELKISLQQLMRMEQEYKVSQKNLLLYKQKRIQVLRLNKTVDHLWKIKEVEYGNIQQVMEQLLRLKDQINPKSERVNGNGDMIRMKSNNKTVSNERDSKSRDNQKVSNSSNIRSKCNNTTTSTTKANNNTCSPTT